MFTDDRGKEPDLFGGTGWQTSGWHLVALVDRHGFVLSRWLPGRRFPLISAGSKINSGFVS